MSQTEYNQPPPRCPKCQGACIPDQDQYGRYLRCMNCGSHSESPYRDPDEPPEDPKERPDPAYYQDLGCSISPKCTQCPLSVCRFDNQNALRRHRNRQEDLRKIDLMRELNLSPEQAAAKFGINPRTIFRIIQRNEKPEQ